MTTRNLGKPLDALDLSSLPPRRTTANDDGCRLLFATVAAAFGLATSSLLHKTCPALEWLHRCREGRATDEDRRLLDEVASTEYFDAPVTTRDYLMAVSKLYRCI